MKQVDPELAHTVATVVEEGTLDGAAARLHLTPSAVSQRVKALEEQFGQRLLVRSKPARATDAGQAVVRYAHHHALLAHDLAVELGSGETETRMRLALAVNADSLATWFMEPMAAFTARHPVEIEIHREDQDHTARLLETGRVVGAVTSQSRAVPGSRSRELGQLVYEPVAAPSWIRRWAPSGVDGAILVVAPRVDYDPHDSLQTDWLSHLGIDPGSAPRHLVPSTHDFARAVELGLGWGMLPVQHSEALVARGQLIRLDGPPAHVTLYWQRWSGASALLDSLTDEVVSAARGSLLAS